MSIFHNEFANTIFVSLKVDYKRLLTPLKRLGLVYILYTVCRFVFFAANFSFFSQFGTIQLVRAFLIGLRFDTTAIMYSNGLFFLLGILPFQFVSNKHYQNTLKWAFWIVNTIALFFNFVDIGYFEFSHKRSGFELFAMTGDIAQHSLQYIIDYWYLALTLMSCSWALIQFYPSSQCTESNTINGWSRFKIVLFDVLLIGIMGLSARGSVGLKPLNTMDAARLTKPELAPLTLNTPFQLIMTAEQTGLPNKQYMTPQEALQYFNPIHQPVQTTPTGKNIVLVIVESLGKEYVGFYNNGKGYTPFLDSLAKHSTVYLNAYANGKRSIEGIPSILASMPALMESDYMNCFYQTNTLYSTGGYLNQIGYDASFYHGGKNGTMSFENFIATTHGGTYYGQNEYPNTKDNDGFWGIFDEPYLQYFAHELSLKKQPFFSSLFTLSSHHPYHIPDDRKNRFADGSLPIHKTIRYVDFALQEFFKTASTQPWYHNTVFIITADHSSINEQTKYKSFEGIYRIPLIVFDPNAPLAKQVTQTTQQLDLLPLVLQVAGFNKPFFSFGNNVDSVHNSFAIQYSNGLYQLIQHPYVLHFDGEQLGGFYKLNANDELKDCSEDDAKRRLEFILKAYIQTYNQAIIQNKTSIPD